MANRCFWLSAAELLIHVFADGDCLQSHKHITVFTKQLQWAMQQCKSALNKDIPEEDRYQEFRNVEAVSVHVTRGIHEKALLSLFSPAFLSLVMTMLTSSRWKR